MSRVNIPFEERTDKLATRQSGLCLRIQFNTILHFEDPSDLSAQFAHPRRTSIDLDEIVIDSDCYCKLDSPGEIEFFTTYPNQRRWCNRRTRRERDEPDSCSERWLGA